MDIFIGMKYPEVKAMLERLRLLAVSGERSDKELLQVLSLLSDIQQSAIQCLELKKVVTECPDIFRPQGQ